MAVWRSTRSEPQGDARPTLFLDRDGVVIRDRDYLADPDQVELLPGVAEALVRARAAGFQLIGVSNQSGIGRGYFGAAELDAVMRRLTAELDAAGVRFDGFYYCPHAPGTGCPCRKPEPGLLVEAAAAWRWPAEYSWVVGDKASDVEFGLRAGLGAVLVRTGYGAAQEASVRRRWPHEARLLTARDLPEAVDLILAASAPQPRKRGT